MSDLELYQCFNRFDRVFLVSITVHKAKDLNVVNSDTFVAVTFNHETKRTKTYWNSSNPFFNAYFVYELKTTLENLLRMNIHFTVFKVSQVIRKTSVIGELNVNLSSIWNQQYHTYIRKWGILEKIDSDNTNVTAGYLQVDLSILCGNEKPAPAILSTYSEDVVEKNLLLPESLTSEPANVKYLVNIFDGNFLEKRDYILQVSFGPFNTRSKIITYEKYCRWNEQMIFYGKFPALNQLVVFELLVQEYFQWRVKCSVELSLTDMYWTIEGECTKPAYGPIHIVFYENEHRNSFYGKLLISIETRDIDEHLTIKSLNAKEEIIMPVNVSEYWDEEVFTVYMTIVNFEAVQTFYKSIKVQLSCDSVTSNSAEIFLNNYHCKKLNLKHSEFPASDRPVLTLSIKLPDNRLRNQAQNLMRMLYREMESNIRNYKLFEAKYYNNKNYRLKCLKMLLRDFKDMLDGMKTKIYCKTFKKLTEWDTNYLKYLQYLFNTCTFKINAVLAATDVNENIKSCFQEYLNIRDAFFMSINENQDSTTNIFLNISKDKKLLGFHRFSVNDYLYSQAFDSRGEFAGKMQSIVVKPSTCTHSCENCGCMFAKLEMIMWIGSDKELNECLPQSIIELSPTLVNFTVESYYKCNAYVHQAKIQPGLCKDDLCDPKLSIMIGGISEQTRVVHKSMSITWNEMLEIDNVKLFDIGSDLYQNYPTVVVKLTNGSKKKNKRFGIAHVKVPIKRSEKKDSHKTDGNALLQPLKALVENPLKALADKNPLKAHDENGQKDNINIRKLFNDVICQFPPQLRWISFYFNGNLTAEVLMSVELVPLQAPTISIMPRTKNEAIPQEISPNIRKFHLEVTFAGIRDAKKMSQFVSGRYKIELSIGELSLTTTFAPKAYKKNQNFLDPYASGYLLLPEEFQFWPSIIIKHLDCSYRTPTAIGAAMIRRPEKFFQEMKPKQIQKFLIQSSNSTKMSKPRDVKIDVDENEPLLEATRFNERLSDLNRILSRDKFLNFFKIPIKSKQVKTILIESQYTWWTKFYNSNRDPELWNLGLHELKVYKDELEKQPEFENLSDWATPIELFKPKDISNQKSLSGEIYAKLKCSIKISKCSGKEFFETENLNLIPSTFRFKRLSNLQVEIPIVIRIYIVQAANLCSRDEMSHTDAFIRIKYGDQTICDRAHYVPNQFSPIFGKRYQINGTVPKDTILKIAIFDHDTLSKDDLIGKTKIDVEDRLRSKYGAACGLQKEYERKGYNEWRHPLQPSEILENLCHENDLVPPEYHLDHVKVAGIEFTDNSLVTKDSNVKERLALSALNKFKLIPCIGHPLVPEHVETRSLYRKDRPGIEQGKLQMWIEIFDPKKTIPEPVDITPVPPRLYELRCIIWNTKDVLLEESNVFGQKMSDIYVKGWMENVNNAQFTDIHYRSLTGDGNFNWRMIFSFRYSVCEDMMIITINKKPFEKFDTDIKMPPVLNLQIWDNDTFSPDDFIGATTINLSHFPQLALTADKCPSKTVTKYENIFAVDGSLKGWVAVYGIPVENEPQKVTGKIEIELEVMTAEQAQINPAGPAREGPLTLPVPRRPDASFNWYQNPRKSMKHIMYPELKKLTLPVCGVILILIIVFLLAGFFLDIPKILINKYWSL